MLKPELSEGLPAKDLFGDIMQRLRDLGVLAFEGGQAVHRTPMSRKRKKER